MKEKPNFIQLLLSSMRKLKRRIKIGTQSYDVWLGISKKSTGKSNVLKVHYYPGNPDNENMKPVAIKSGFKSEEEAIKYGLQFMTELYANAIERNSPKKIIKNQ